MNQLIFLAKKKKATLIWLDVWKKNTRAINFYKYCGFQIKKEWIFQLGDDLQDDYIMEKNIIVVSNSEGIKGGAKLWPRQKISK